MRRDIFQAIAGPTRRAIIAMIAIQAMTPNALSEHFEISRQKYKRNHLVSQNIFRKMLMNGEGM